jgi:hypothetical protein
MKKAMDRFYVKRGSSSGYRVGDTMVDGLVVYSHYD